MTAAVRQFNIRGMPNTEPLKITFPSDGRKLAGDLYLPEGRSDGGRVAAVVVVGASSGTKEQTPAVYSRHLTELGYAALAFDHSTYGESEGTPRNDENPLAKSEDIKSAVSFLRNRAEVDGDRIGGLRCVCRRGSRALHGGRRQADQGRGHRERPARPARHPDRRLCR